MAALSLREDSATGQLILEPRVLPALLSVLGNLVWFVVIGLFFIYPLFTGGGFDSQNLIILAFIFVFSLLPSLAGLFSSAVLIQPANRTLLGTTRLLLLPIRSTSLSFSNLANIEVQYYRAPSRRNSREMYRVNAIDRSGSRMLVNWDGTRDEMFALAQKISSMTGAPLLDHASRPASSLDQVVEMAKNLGLPVPQETASPQESTPSMSTQESSAMDEQTEYTVPTTLATEMPAFVPSSETPMPVSPDLASLSVSELEQRVAGDLADSYARYALARKYHASGQLDRAIEMYQATMQTDTSNAEAQNDLGVALWQSGKRKDSEAAYRRAVALDPFSFSAHLNLALLLRSMNRASEASQEFFQARQNARGDDETRLAEAASTGARVEPQLAQK